jgi:hypothetical protein
MRKSIILTLALCGGLLASPAEGATLSKQSARKEAVRVARAEARSMGRSYGFLSPKVFVEKASECRRRSSRTVDCDYGISMYEGGRLAAYCSGSIRVRLRNNRPRGRLHGEQPCIGY